MIYLSNMKQPGNWWANLQTRQVSPDLCLPRNSWWNPNGWHQRPVFTPTLGPDPLGDLTIRGMEKFTIKWTPWRNDDGENDGKTKRLAIGFSGAVSLKTKQCHGDESQFWYPQCLGDNHMACIHIISHGVGSFLGIQDRLTKPCICKLSLTVSTPQEWLMMFYIESN